MSPNHASERMSYVLLRGSKLTTKQALLLLDQSLEASWGADQLSNA